MGGKRREYDQPITYYQYSREVYRHIRNAYSHCLYLDYGFRPRKFKATYNESYMDNFLNWQSCNLFIIYGGYITQHFKIQTKR